jgi:hypothetical protein
VKYPLAMNIYCYLSCDYRKRILLKTFTAFFAASALLTQLALAQVTDNFTDGDFSINPAWTGTTSKFIVSTDKLKLQAPVVNDHAHLSTASVSINNASWEFLCHSGLILPLCTSVFNFRYADLSASLMYIFVGNVSYDLSLSLLLRISLILNRTFELCANVRPEILELFNRIGYIQFMEPVPST